MIFEVGLRSNWASKPMKMTFLLFCVVIFNDTRFFSTYFAVHCCLVWCVGVPQSFFTVHNECDSTFVESLKSKKKYETTSEILFESLNSYSWQLKSRNQNFLLENRDFPENCECVRSARCCNPTRTQEKKQHDLFGRHLWCQVPYGRI